MRCPPLRTQRHVPTGSALGAKQHSCVVAHAGSYTILYWLVKKPCAVRGAVGWGAMHPETSDDLVRGVLRIEGALNVRDLGGLPLEGGGTTRSGRLIRSDSPHALTDAGLEELARIGVRTVVDLRTSREREQLRSRLGEIESVTLIAAPIFADDDPLPDPPLFSPGDIYSWWLDERRDRVAAALRAIAASPSAPVLVHCHAGKDRTGVVVALVLRLAGVPAGVVADDYAHSGVGLRDLLDGERRRRLARGDDPDVVEQHVTVPRDAMLATLAHLDARYGGVEAYAASAGFAGEVRRLRMLMVADQL